MPNDLRIKIKFDQDSGELKVAKKDMDLFGRSIKKTDSYTDKFNKRLVQMTHAFGGLYAAKKTFEIMTVTVTDFANTAGEFERYNNVLTTLEGSSLKAGKSFDWIKEFTAKTPYQMAQVTDSFVKLKAYGIDATDGILKTLGDTSSAMGKDLNQAVEAVADAMTGEFERLKEFGIKASKQGKEATFQYVNASGDAREITVENNQKIIKSTLEAIWNEKYSGAMANMMNTYEGMLSNMEDNWTNFKVEMISSSGVFDALKVGISEINNQFSNLSEDEMQQFINITRDSFEFLLDSVMFAIESTGNLVFGFQLLRQGIEQIGVRGKSAFAHLQKYGIEAYLGIAEAYNATMPDILGLDVDLKDSKRELLLLERDILDYQVEYQNSEIKTIESAEKINLVLEKMRAIKEKIANAPTISEKDKKDITTVADTVVKTFKDKKEETKRAFLSPYEKAMNEFSDIVADKRYYKKLEDEISDSISSAFENGINDVLQGDFAFDSFAKNFSNIFTQQFSKDLMGVMNGTGGGISSAGWYGLAAGVGINLLGSSGIFGGKAEKSPQEKASDWLEKIDKSITEQTNILSKQGLDGTAGIEQIRAYKNTIITELQAIGISTSGLDVTSLFADGNNIYSKGSGLIANASEYSTGGTRRTKEAFARVGIASKELQEVLLENGAAFSEAGLSLSSLNEELGNSNAFLIESAKNRLAENGYIIESAEQLAELTQIAVEAGDILDKSNYNWSKLTQEQENALEIVDNFGDEIGTLGESFTQAQGEIEEFKNAMGGFSSNIATSLLTAKESYHDLQKSIANILNGSSESLSSIAFKISTITTPEQANEAYSLLNDYYKGQKEILELQDDVSRTLRDFVDDLQISSLANNLKTDALFRKYQSTLSDLVTGVATGDEDVNKLSSRTTGYASKYLDSLRRTSGSKTQFEYEQAKIISELSSISSGIDETTLDDVNNTFELLLNDLNTNIGINLDALDNDLVILTETMEILLGSNNDLVSWLKEIRLGVTDLSLSEYTAQAEIDNLFTEKITNLDSLSEGQLLLLDDIQERMGAEFELINTANTLAVNGIEDVLDDANINIEDTFIGINEEVETTFVSLGDGLGVAITSTFTKLNSGIITSLNSELSSASSSLATAVSNLVSASKNTGNQSSQTSSSANKSWWEQYLEKYPNLLNYYYGVDNPWGKWSDREGKGTDLSKETFAYWHYYAYGQGEGKLAPFANGGIVTKPTIGLIGEAGYPEIKTNNGVVPLKNPNDPLNSNAIISELKDLNQRISKLQTENTKMRKILSRQEVREEQTP